MRGWKRAAVIIVTFAVAIIVAEIVYYVTTINHIH